MEFMETSAEIQAPISLCYQHWRNFEAFPDYMHNVIRVEHKHDNFWEWTLIDKKGGESVWVFALESDLPDKLIFWRTISGPEIEMYVSVYFKEIEPKRTLITINLAMEPLDCYLGKLLTDIYAVNREALEMNLIAFKRRTEEFIRLGYPANLRQTWSDHRGSQMADAGAFPPAGRSSRIANPLKHLAD